MASLIEVAGDLLVGFPNCHQGQDLDLALAERFLAWSIPVLRGCWCGAVYLDRMAYHALEESRKLITEGVPEVTFRLTRRRRFLPVACDVDGELAATLFLRRGVSGDPWLESWTLKHSKGEWVLLGGGAGNGYEEVFTPRPSMSEWGSLAIDYGGGSTLVNADRLMPWGARYVDYARMRLVSEVARLLIRSRSIDVPQHGLAIVVWATKTPPEVRAVSASGSLMGVVDLRDDPLAVQMPRYAQ